MKTNQKLGILEKIEGMGLKGEENFSLTLSLEEWVELYQILLFDKKQKHLISEELKAKLFEIGPVKVVMELMQQLQSWDEEHEEIHQKVASEIEAIIVSSGVVSIITPQKETRAFPLKVLHLEGELTVIGEDVEEHCMVVIPIKEILTHSAIAHSGHSKVSYFELEEFIAAIRKMNEKETRLILKIHDHEFLNLNPHHQFLGKPCMVTNPVGDLIWAAYVEPCDALFEWLITLGKKVEILDPLNFREKFLEYCEDKLRKIA